MILMKRILYISYLLKMKKINKKTKMIKTKMILLNNYNYLQILKNRNNSQKQFNQKDILKYQLNNKKINLMNFSNTL